MILLQRLQEKNKNKKDSFIKIECLRLCPFVLNERAALESNLFRKKLDAASIKRHDHSIRTRFKHKKRIEQRKTGAHVYDPYRQLT